MNYEPVTSDGLTPNLVFSNNNMKVEDAVLSLPPGESTMVLRTIAVTTSGAYNNEASIQKLMMNGGYPPALSPKG